VNFGLRMQHRPRGEVEARAREVLALVGLDGFEHRRVSELSGGEQQRVALARALAPAPRLLMLDEPLGALDRALRERLVAELRALFVRLGLTIVFVTHDHDEAFALADRVVLMHQGRIVQQGRPAEVWEQPADAFVARFLGWNVTRLLGNGQVAVRPESLRLTGTGDVHGVVTGRTFHRDHFLVDVDADGETLRIAVPVGDDVPELGARVSVAVDPGTAIAV
jgi:thiamine transport system ATP-binding protein